MKRQILLLTLSPFLFVSTKAQIQKKDILLGGTLGYYASDFASDNNNNSSSNASINPRIGYAIGKNSVLSLRGGYGYSSSENEAAEQDFTSHSFTAGLSWQKFFPFKANLGLFTDLSGGYVTGRTKNTSPLGEAKADVRGYNASLNPGFYFLPGKNFMITASTYGIKYSHTKMTSTGSEDVKASEFGVALFNSFVFGIDFIINNKKNN